MADPPRVSLCVRVKTRVLRHLQFPVGENHLPASIRIGMAGQGYTTFDTTVGRCGIAWGEAGIVGVQLPEARELETRRRLLHQYPDAREWRPPADVQHAIDGIVATLNGKPIDLSDIPLDT